VSLLARPEFAPLFLLVPLVPWLARRAARPPEVPIGTFELWQDVAELHGGARRAERRVPAWAWAAAVAILCAALAAVGPRGGTRATRTWTVWVDLSPSLHLPLASGTRLDAALEALAGVLRAELAPGDRVRWRALGREPLELDPFERPRQAWLAPGPMGEPEPEWAAHDEPGTLWVTDRVPTTSRTNAWLVASGGPGVPGAVAGDGRERVEVDAEGALVRVSVPAEGGVVVRGALPAVLERALRAWSEARGYVFGAHPDGARLVLEAAEAGDEELVLLGPGFRSAARGGATARSPGEEAVWLARTADGRELPVLLARPGRLRVHLRELAEPEGDPAAFALACGRLFDRFALPRLEVVSLAERAAAGPGGIERGAAPSATPRDEPGVVEALLAGLAALATGFSLAFGRSSAGLAHRAGA